MAASDKPFRSQYTLDVVYAVSCILMLLSILWMLWQDYNREYKHEQRAFREVEVALAQRQALEQIPSKEDFDKALKDVEEKRKLKDDPANQSLLANARSEMLRLQPLKEKSEARFQTVKADVESITSFRSIALEHQETVAAGKYDTQLNSLNIELAKAQKERDLLTSQMKIEQLKVDQIEGAFNKSTAELKKVNDRFDTQVKLALNKRWGWGDWFRTQPVINGFADPLKIHQITINDIPIDYNFKQVSRFDRCMSCHVGIDRPAFTRANLEMLTKEDAHKAKLETAKALYNERMKALAGLKEADTVPDPNQLQISVLSDKLLTPARVTEFCAHPRLDLFVGSNSKHPAEKFGCTSCHAGQGSGTSFTDASHTPNTSKGRKVWAHDRDWESNHMWDFPMLPARFVESSCLKCHHEVTDLISSNNRVEAPKLLKGHELIRENGCFGCHEISGWKSGQRIGPDMRLEPSPPLSDLNPIERQRVESDTDNRPGNLRKVGPALSRVSEKVHQGWIKKWLRSPSDFRPDTKMPHYYGLSNNHESMLPEEQKKFPNTEIASIAHFLMTTSKNYVKQAVDIHKQDNPQVRQADEQRLVELLNKGRLDVKDKQEIDQVKMRIKLRKEAPLVDLVPAKEYPGKAEQGRLLFTTKGCLACHVHKSTEKDAPAAGKTPLLPELKGEAVFGPDLTQLTGKFGTTAKDKENARTWLIQWVLDPHVHSPRSRMPVTHLTKHEAADVAAWLLAQPSTEHGPDWDKIVIDEPKHDDLVNLAKVYLVRVLSTTDIDRFFKGMTPEEQAKYNKGEVQDDSLRIILNDIGEDEKELFRNVTNDEGIKYYLGKKAVSRLGCYGCHDIPGFENAKPIGVALNDWGKKPADKLAFEDIGNFFGKHYYPVESLLDKDGKPYGVKDENGIKKEPYEQFYVDALLGHNPERAGYLNQKIRDPRSYDFNRIRPWDDRARMPQFHLARARKKAGEDEAALQARMFKDEAEAREKVSTFVLGLVAEQVPSKSINQPSGDRLAEVKGRQVLDKFNCNGCHLIRPGVYDFKIDSKLLTGLDEKHAAAAADQSTEYVFKNHHNWVGRNPLGTDRLTAFVVKPTFQKNEDDNTLSVNLYLMEALRYVGADKSVKNIPSGMKINVPLENLTPQPGFQSQADFERAFQAEQPFGGTFADLMVPWLAKFNPERFKFEAGDSKEARHSLPPSLIGEGERTRPDWLYQFLLNPQPVRRMTILQMPKFNISPQEAQILVDYFAAISRQNNPGIGLAYPHEIIPQQAGLDSDYWKFKTKEYVALLQKTPARDEKGNPLKGKDGKEVMSFEQRVKEYQPLWKKIAEENLAPVMKSVQKLDELIETKKKEKELKNKSLGDKGANKEAIQKEMAELERTMIDADNEKTSLLKQLDTKHLQKVWEEKEAYASDAYRMLTSTKLCAQCHQIGSIKASEDKNEGPPLALAHERLRPEWIVRWVDKPQRFLPYVAIMPPYFSSNELKWQEYHVGAGMHQIQAVRDVLTNYPRISEMPVNRLYIPNPPAEKK